MPVTVFIWILCTMFNNKLFIMYLMESDTKKILNKRQYEFLLLIEIWIECKKIKLWVHD